MKRALQKSIHILQRCCWRSQALQYAYRSSMVWRIAKCHQGSKPVSKHTQDLSSPSPPLYVKKMMPHVMMNSSRKQKPTCWPFLAVSCCKLTFFCFSSAVDKKLRWSVSAGVFVSGFTDPLWAPIFSCQENWLQLPPWPSLVPKRNTV